jgi:hypothetical protein
MALFLRNEAFPVATPMNVSSGDLHISLGLMDIALPLADRIPKRA